MRWRVLVAQAATLATVTMVFTGCSTTGSDKSGGVKQPTILVMASNDGESLIGAPAVAWFVDRVAQLSGGRLTVRVESSWRGGGDESKVIKDVAAGQADLGWAGTRAFDRVGVDNFRPLHAPFLVSSYAAETAIVTDPLARELLDSLRPMGLTGLAMAADQLRFPTALAKPLLTPADFKGLRFNTVGSDIQTDGIRALGAEPVSGNIEALAAGGDIGGFETMWWTYSYQANGLVKLAPFVTANAVLWPRTVAIFANTNKLSKLDQRARGWITQAAAEASAWSTTHAADAEPGHIQTACQSGARVATATPQQLAALRAAAEPVYAAMRADPALAPTLTRVQALAAAAAPATRPAVPQSCVYQPGNERAIPPPPTGLTSPGRTGDLPPGTYRYSNTAAELRARGMSDHDATNNAGVLTWTLRDGHWSSRQDPVDTSVKRTTCEGWYDVQGDTVTFTTTTRAPVGLCAPPNWTARWSGRGDTISWNAVSDDFALVFAGKPWQRIS